MSGTDDVCATEAQHNHIARSPLCQVPSQTKDKLMADDTVLMHPAY